MADIRECSNLVICPQSPWRHLTVYTKVTKDKTAIPLLSAMVVILAVAQSYA